MNKITKIFLVGIFLHFSFCSLLLAQENADKWELAVKEGNIKVYTRDVSHSSIKEVRIKAKFDIDMNAFIEVLNDVSSYNKWVYKCNNPKQIFLKNTNDICYYIQSDLPFPLSDRDLVVRSKQWRDEMNNSYHTHSVTMPNIVDEKDGIVRIQYYESFWNIHQGKDGFLYIDYRVITDPGGFLPAWLVNMAITQGPMKTMKNLESFAKQRETIFLSKNNK